MTNMNAIKKTLEVLTILVKLDDYIWHKEKLVPTRDVMVLLLQRCLDELNDSSEQTKIKEKKQDE